MSGTEITAIEAEPIDLTLRETFRIATGAQQVARNVLVTVRLANGVVGLGEAAPMSPVSGETQETTLQALERAAVILSGGDARRWRLHAQRLQIALADAPAARCAAEMALLDALARTLDLPLSLWFGGSATETPLRTDLTITAHTTAHGVSRARSMVEKGFRTAKVKVGADTVEADVARMKAIAEAAPGLDFVVDANGGYSADDALALVDAAGRAQLPVRLFEQPLAREDHSGWQTFAETLPPGVRICADESARSAADVIALARLGCVTHVNIKVMKSGVAEALAIWSTARAAGMGLMIGGMLESILAMSFSAHFAAGLGGFDFIDLDTPLFIAEHPFKGGYTLDGDAITLPAEHKGHGVSLA